MKAFLRKARGGSQNGGASMGDSITPPLESAPVPGGKLTKVQAKPKSLKINTDASESDHENQNSEKYIPATPATTKSTSSDEEDNDDDSSQSSLSNTDGPPSSPLPRKAGSAVSTMTPAPALRSDADLRSPGVKATPMSELNTGGDTDDNVPLPSFITQTDKDGKSLTTKPPTAIGARSNGNAVTTLARPAKEETLLDSLRTMCCCLALDESPSAQKNIAAKALPAINSPRANNATKVEVVEKVPYNFVLPPSETRKKCLVLDLDETLVHSSFRPVPTAHFILPVQVDNVMHSVYVAKRPGAEDFLRDMAKHFEVVVYTASLNKYADPLLDLLDPTKTWVTHRLFREHCTFFEGHYVKDLDKLNRPLEGTILVDNSPNSYIFHPKNAIDCSSFIDDMKDRELEQIGAFLKGIAHTKDVRNYCSKWRDWPDLAMEADDAPSLSNEKVDLLGEFTVEAKDGSAIHSLD